MDTHAHRYLIVGAGLQARASAHLFLNQPDTERVVFFERDAQAIAAMKAALKEHKDRVEFHQGDAVKDARALADLVPPKGNVLSAARYSLNPAITRMVISKGGKMVDLGGNPMVVREQHAMHAQAVRMGAQIIPDCGVAPGMASTFVARGLEMLPTAVKVRIYCGGLPQRPAGFLKYALFFDPSGLINEYNEMCDAIVKGHRVKLNPLFDRHTFIFQGIGEVVAANTSGGTSTMPDTYVGRLQELVYQTIRYPGEKGQPDHWETMQALKGIGMFENRFHKFSPDGVETVSPRETLERFLRYSLPKEQPDLLGLMAVLTDPSGKSVMVDLVDRMDRATGLSAMQRTTGFDVAVKLRMLARGEITEKGVLKNELHVPPAAYLAEIRRAGINVHESYDEGFESPEPNPPQSS